MVVLPKTSDLYVIALGSNMRHGRFGAPEAVLGATVGAMVAAGVAVCAVAPVIRSAPVGPSLRRYANGAVVARWGDGPPALLAALKRIEREFGRKSGQRWASRVVDLDIILWSGGVWRSKTLCVPHRLYAQRDFVLRPILAIAPRWRDPITGFHAKAHFSRLTKAREMPRGTPPRPIRPAMGAHSSVGRATDF
jgi:2-amino-4-hydroxy-6-hydroxymethyldihydropteridine diphosphokinase